MIEGIFEIRNSLGKFIESFLTDSIATTRRLRNSQIGKGFLQFQEFFLKSSNSGLQIFEVFFLELLKFCSESLSLKFEGFLDIIYLLEKHFLQVFDFLVCVASKLYAKWLQVISCLFFEGLELASKLANFSFHQTNLLQNGRCIDLSTSWDWSVIDRFESL